MERRIVLRRDLIPVGAVSESKEARKVAVVPEGKDRLNLQIDEKLKRWAQDYAQRHHTSLTQMIADHFVDLQKREDGEGVDQIGD